jgi:HEAT repeat protein
MISDLARAVRGTAIYPPRHPGRERLLARLHQRMSALLEQLGAVEIEVTSRGLAYAGDPLVNRDGSAASLGESLFARLVRVVRFLKGITPSDIEGLADLLRTVPEEVRSAGGASILLGARGVRGIQLEEVDYQGILQRREESSSAEAGYNTEVDAPAGAPEQTAVRAVPPTFDDSGVAEVSQEKWLEEKLWELDSARDFPAYKAVLRDIFLNLRSTGALHLPLFNEMVLRRLGRHFKEAGRAEVREVVQAAIRELATPEVIELMVGKFTQRNLPDRHALEAVFSAVEERAIPALLVGLANAEGAYGRKALMTALVSFGDKVLPHLKGWLDDGRWFVVRNALTLLTEAGDEKDAPLVQPMLSHDNPRVRMEAIRFFTRHPFPGVERRLIALLQDRDPEVRSRAIFSLGARGGRNALGRLARLARKPFWGEGDVALRETAIRALGRMGGEMSVAFLRHLLVKRGWAEPEEHARIAKVAVDALAEIGDRAALAALSSLRPRLSGEAFRAAEDFLRRSAGGSEAS